MNYDLIVKNARIPQGDRLVDATIPVDKGVIAGPERGSTPKIESEASVAPDTTTPYFVLPVRSLPSIVFLALLIVVALPVWKL